MDWPTLLRGIHDALASDLGRAEKAVRVAALIRQAGGYRWVGLYAVTDREIAAVGWSGPGAPAHLRFPVTQGLSGAAVASGRAVVAGDVTADPRYLTAFASTLSEAIVPVVDPATGTVVGTLDVESAERDAFTDADRQTLERCAAALAGLFADADPDAKAGYELAFEDTFDGDVLDQARWLPCYLPQWSSREAAAARYQLGGGVLRLVIEADQQPWCPEFDGQTRVSSLQTGVFAGPVGSTVGQSRFTPGLVVRQAQQAARLYTPRYGLFELRAKALDDPRCMVALWMIGYEDRPERSAEICICEIFGRNVAADSVGVGMGLHPFGDPAIRDEFSVENVAIDARQFHTYAAEWTPEHVAFFVDHRLVKLVEQSPTYPMQFMLGIYEFPDDGQAPQPARPYPKQFVVDYVRGYRPTGGRR
jgi:putative methionine-R-sulfoxide reductase with GAF domain